MSEFKSIEDRAKFILKATLISGCLGCFQGVTIAALKGESKFAYGLMNGSNWIIISCPFFSIREAILYRKHYKNIKEGRSNLLYKSKDDAIASSISGMIVGGGLLYWKKGKYAIPAGVVFFGLGFSTLQFGYSLFREYRLNKAVSLANIPIEEDLKKKPSIFENPFKDHDSFDFMKVEEASDPVRYIIEGAINILQNTLGKFPDWLSPVANALDPVYRSKLNTRIYILETQIKELEAKIKNAKKI
ncbi:hypothetical protein HK099_004766 [Clydaea vesicula]|uniref:Transmembrane protein n=1 Tax=Clydaea vesicula TaxID=447962 RepID=A0AAD5U2K0_9FUNG|nr:hypothetical protein HK099_004766 [Clydaea vesicula]KAJ3397581.1 hypothetical protein HDU92_006376 [Lobulomyces angularis]